MTFTIFDAVANINNRINSNNNNNNNDNINFQQSVNTVVSGNINVANQINVMMGMGRRRREAGEGRVTREMKKQAGRVAMMGIQAMVTLDKSLNDQVAMKQLHNRLDIYSAMI